MSDYKLNPSVDPQSPTKIYIPADVEDCVEELNKILPVAIVDEIRSCEESDLVKYHFSLGTWMRNGWGLWMEVSRLRCYFVGLGVSDADDMTRIILACYWDVLNDRPVDIRRRIVYNRIDRDQILGGPKPST
jgi:hypothetical protein